MVSMRRASRVAVVGWLLVVAAGTAAARPPTACHGRQAWEAAVAALGLDLEEAIYPFATNPEMDAWIADFDRRFGRMEGTERLRRLQQVLFDPGQFPFAYDQAVTLTAAEAFAQRRGNCMAFTVLFVALSRGLGLDTFLVAVSRPPEVERQADLVVVNRHVVAGYSHAGQLYLYDFYVTSEVPYVSHRLIDDVKASAMFHTNLGGAAVRDGDLATARRHLELASRLDPGLASAWVNLGVVRFRSGEPEGALAAYEAALKADPDHPSALTNMAYVYRQQGLEEEAENALRAAAAGRSSPFTLIALADVEMTRGNLDRARGYLYRARRMAGREPEVHDALARLEQRAGDALAATRHRRRADKLRLEAAAEPD